MRCSGMIDFLLVVSGAAFPGIGLGGAGGDLLKVLNDGNGWAACLRITGRAGKALSFEQREREHGGG